MILDTNNTGNAQQWINSFQKAECNTSMILVIGFSVSMCMHMCMHACSCSRGHLLVDKDGRLGVLTRPANTEVESTPPPLLCCVNTGPTRT